MIIILCIESLDIFANVDFLQYSKYLTHNIHLQFEQ